MKWHWQGQRISVGRSCEYESLLATCRYVNVWERAIADVELKQAVSVWKVTHRRVFALVHYVGCMPWSNWYPLFSELTQIVGDVVADPTLPRTEDHPCPKCAHKEAVFFQSHSTKAEVSHYVVMCHVYVCVFLLFISSSFLRLFWLLIAFLRKFIFVPPFLKSEVTLQPVEILHTCRMFSAHR